MEQKDWGKPWTYLSVSIIWLLITALVWAMVEERRDSDAAAFYQTAKDNYEQVESLRAYAWADSSNCIDRTAIKSILRSISIVRTRAEADSLKAIRDSLAAIDTVKTSYWVLAEGNFYPHNNAAKPLGAAVIDGFTPINSGKISITSRATSGSSAIEIDGNGVNSGAQTSFAADNKAAYIVEFDVNSNKAGSVVEVFADNIEVAQYSITNQWKTFKTQVIDSVSLISMRYYFEGTSVDGNEIYIDNIRVSKYELKINN